MCPSPRREGLFAYHSFLRILPLVSLSTPPTVSPPCTSCPYPPPPILSPSTSHRHTLATPGVATITSPPSPPPTSHASPTPHAHASPHPRDAWCRHHHLAPFSPSNLPCLPNPARLVRPHPRNARCRHPPSPHQSMLPCASQTIIEHICTASVRNGSWSHHAALKRSTRKHLASHGSHNVCTQGTMFSCTHRSMNEFRS